MAATAHEAVAPTVVVRWGDACGADAWDGAHVSCVYDDTEIDERHCDLTLEEADRRMERIRERTGLPEIDASVLVSELEQGEADELVAKAVASASFRDWYLSRLRPRERAPIAEWLDGGLSQRALDVLKGLARLRREGRERP